MPLIFQSRRLRIIPPAPAFFMAGMNVGQAFYDEGSDWSDASYIIKCLARKTRR
jgi:hypothetical protein